MTYFTPTAKRKTKKEKKNKKRYNIYKKGGSHRTRKEKKR
jgi:hypothetical protein